MAEEPPVPTLWVPPHVEFEELQKRFRESQSAQLVRIDGDTFIYEKVPDTLAKSVNERLPVGQPYRLAPLPNGVGTYLGVREKHTARMPADVLRLITLRNPVVAAAFRRRQNQIAAFAKKPRYDGDTGMQVVMRDQTARMTPAAKQRAEEIWTVLREGGFRRPKPGTGGRGERAVWNAEGSEKAPGLQQAIRALVWDSLVLDAAAFRIEVGQNEKKYPVAWWAPVDASLIRYTVTEETGKQAVRDSWGSGQDPYKPEIRPATRPAFVMLEPDNLGVQREFQWNELAYLVRNPRTDYRVQGYGLPELEMLVDIVTGLLNGIHFNTNYFDENHIPPGIISLVGDYNDTTLQAFRLQLKMMVGGPGQFWKVPILTAKEGSGAASYVPIRQTMDGTGMFWKDWILACGSWICALIGMDSTEINMVNLGTSQSALGNSNPVGKIESTQESGLEPMVVQVCDFFDENIVRRIDEDFALEPAGLSRRDQAEEQASSAHRMQFALATPNRELARADEKPIRDPLDPALWRAVRKAVAEEKGIDVHDLDRMEDEDLEQLCVDAYEEADGEWAKWPDAPVGNLAALQVWMAEHKIGQEQPGMDGMPPGMADPNDPTAQNGAPDAQDGQEMASDPSAGPMGPGGAPGGPANGGLQPGGAPATMGAPSTGATPFPNLGGGAVPSSDQPFGKSLRGLGRRARAFLLR
jgi:hypothetical protein